MKALLAVVILSGVPGLSQAADESETSPSDLEAIKAELKPLRQEAYREADVVAARKELDAAYRKYWDTVRDAMKRLEPAKAALIDRDVEARKATSSVSSRVDADKAKSE